MAKRGTKLLLLVFFLIFLSATVYAQINPIGNAFQSIEDLVRSYPDYQVGFDALMLFSFFLTITSIVLKKKLGSESDSRRSATALSIILSIFFTFSTMRFIIGSDRSISDFIGGFLSLLLLVLFLGLLAYLLLHFKIIPEEQKGYVYALIGLVVLLVLGAIPAVNQFLLSQPYLLSIISIVSLILIFIVVMGTIKILIFIFRHTRTLSNKEFELSEKYARQKQYGKIRKFEESTRKELMSESANIKEAKRVLGDLTAAIPTKNIKQFKMKPAEELFSIFGRAKNLARKLEELQLGMSAYQGFIGVLQQRAKKLGKIGITTYDAELTNLSRQIGQRVNRANNELRSLLAEVSKDPRRGGGPPINWDNITKALINLNKIYDELMTFINFLTSFQTQIEYEYENKTARP